MGRNALGPLLGTSDMTTYQRDPRQRLDALLPRALDRLESLLEPRDPCEACGRSDDDVKLVRAIENILDRTGYGRSTAVTVGAASEVREIRRIIVHPQLETYNAPVNALPALGADPVGDTPQPPETIGLLGESTDPDPSPVCAYCHQSPARCAQIKEQRLDDWRALHYSDPEEGKRRGDEATAEMYESLRRARRGL